MGDRGKECDEKGKAANATENIGEDTASIGKLAMVKFVGYHKSEKSDYCYIGDDSSEKIDGARRRNTQG